MNTNIKMMALHDENGTILAAVQVTEGYYGPVPVVVAGTRLVTLDVLYTPATPDFATICTRMRVDTRTSTLVERGDPTKA
jgi:hypothetical protein